MLIPYSRYWTGLYAGRVSQFILVVHSTYNVFEWMKKETQFAIDQINVQCELLNEK